MLEFVDSDLYFVQDKNNVKKKTLLQVGSGSGSVEKITGSGGAKITGSSSLHPTLCCFPFLKKSEKFLCYPTFCCPCEEK